MRPPRPIVVESDDAHGDEGVAVPDRFVSARKARTREDRIVAYAEILNGDVTEGEVRALESAIDSMARREARFLGLDTDPGARQPQDQQIVLLNREVIHESHG